MRWTVFLLLSAGLLLAAACEEEDGQPTPTATAEFEATDTPPPAPTDTPLPPEPTEPPTQPPAPTEPEPRADCDPSYPDVCIPQFPPDLDCPDVGFQDFRVVGSDPHGFDRDQDGVGCES